MNISKIVDNMQSDIEKTLGELITADSPKVLVEAMRYSALSGGKRLRPMLSLFACYICSGEYKQALKTACSLELIHTYSLIHDDLPEMDDDEYRRGRLTNHKVFGHGMALLAGDGLLNLAYETLSNECMLNLSINFAKAMNLIAVSAGINGMIAGQTSDMLNENNNQISIDELNKMHYNKTARLFIAALSSGALIGGCDDETYNKFYLLGEKIGLAFQIKDDLLDVTSTLEVLGKQTNADGGRNKLTYVSYYGLETAEKKYQELCDEIIIFVSDFGNNEFDKYIYNLLYRNK